MNPNILQSPTVPGTDEIREILIQRVDQQKQAPGIVVGVIEPNGRRVVAYGNLAKGDPRPIDGDTIFEIGSISKVFTSLLLADMVSRKEVALDDPAAKYLPEHVRMPGRSGKAITLFDLSTHSSGLPRVPGNLNPRNPANPYADYSVDDLYKFLGGYTLPRDPGSEIEYSNLGAGLLGHILACRIGTGYETWSESASQNRSACRTRALRFLRPCSSAWQRVIMPCSRRSPTGTFSRLPVPAHCAPRLMTC